MRELIIAWTRCHETAGQLDAAADAGADRAIALYDRCSAIEAALTAGTGEARGLPGPDRALALLTIAERLMHEEAGSAEDLPYFAPLITAALVALGGASYAKPVRTTAVRFG